MKKAEEIKTYEEALEVFNEISLSSGIKAAITFFGGRIPHPSHYETMDH